MSACDSTGMEPRFAISAIRDSSLYTMWVLHITYLSHSAPLYKGDIWCQGQLKLKMFKIGSIFVRHEDKPQEELCLQVERMFFNHRRRTEILSSPLTVIVFVQSSADKEWGLHEEGSGRGGVILSHQTWGSGTMRRGGENEFRSQRQMGVISSTVVVHPSWPWWW